MKVAAGLSRWRKSRGRGTPTLPGLDTTAQGNMEGGSDGGGRNSDARSGKEDPRLAELRVKMRAVHKLRAEQAAASHGQDEAAVADDKPRAPRRARLKVSLEKEEQKERYPGARGSIFHQWHRQHIGHQANPKLRKHDLMDYLGDPDHAYCILHRHDRIAEKKRREKLKAARAAQALGRQEHHGVGNTLVKRGGGQTMLATEREKLRQEWLDAKEVTHERLANPWPKPPPTLGATVEGAPVGTAVASTATLVAATSITTSSGTASADLAACLALRFALFRADLEGPASADRTGADVGGPPAAGGWGEGWISVCEPALSAL